jgi:hypothetical protein
LSSGGCHLGLSSGVVIWGCHLGLSSGLSSELSSGLSSGVVILDLIYLLKTLLTPPKTIIFLILYRRLSSGTIFHGS